MRNRGREQAETKSGEPMFLMEQYLEPFRSVVREKHDKILQG